VPRIRRRIAPRLSFNLTMSHGSRALWRVVGLAASLVLSATAVGVVGVASPAGADTATFSSAGIGTTGHTPSFNQTGPWTMAWTYNCSNIYGGTGNFIVNIVGSNSDLGTNEVGAGRSGTDFYYDTGSFNLSVVSQCNWTITVSSGAGTPGTTPLTITSTQVGVTGNSQSFSVGGTWSLAWSYNCANTFDGTGIFIVNIDRPPGSPVSGIGPNEAGRGASGTATYSDTGTLVLRVISECSWSILISSGAASPQRFPVTGMASTPDGGGYWIADAHGGVETRGDAVNFGSMAGVALDAPITHIVSTPDGLGYWLVAADGGTFSFGDALFYGSMGGQHLNAPVVALAPTPDGAGYWLVASDGGIFSFGDAQFYGSMGGRHLNQPVVGMAVDHATGGYWEVASDGGIFSFSAPFFGSTGSIHLNSPINGMAATPDGGGYWLVASDGGIFNAGDASFYGSMGGTHLNAPVVGMAPGGGMGGYWLVASDGGIFAFNTPFYGAG
jgi:hypothetical protein